MATPAPHDDGSTTEAAVHRYRADLTWSGSTGVGYDAYDRTHAMDGWHRAIERAKGWASAD